jgi:hypothetical protein
VEVLERMATVSTSARLRRIQLGLPEPWDPQAGAAKEPPAGDDGGGQGGDSTPGGSPAAP